MFTRNLGQPWRMFKTTTKLLAATHWFWSYQYSWGRTSGPSMLPEWSIWGEGAVVSHVYRRGRGVEVGDLVQFKVPFTDDYAIKRVVGLAGDYVMIHTPDSGSEAMIQVPRGHCWVVGDNLPASRDSRLYGPVPMALIEGKVILKTGSWPWQLQWIKNPLQENEIT